MRKISLGIANILICSTTAALSFPAESVKPSSSLCTNSLVQLHQSIKQIKRFPIGANTTKNSSDHFQFGFESEYLLNETAGILRHYAPDPKLGVTKKHWLAMGDEERLTWTKENIKALFPNFREKGNLVKISEDLPDTFPDRVIRDETGNIEVIAGPFDTYEEWDEFVKLNNERFGLGSMQGTLSMKWKHFFSSQVDSASDNSHLLPLAHLRAHNEIDQILKLYAAAKKIPEKGPFRTARNFEHPFLAPMSLDKELMMIEHMQKHARGQGFEKSLLDDISHSDASYKYIGGIAYRPDIVGEKRVVLEARHTHKNEAILRKKINELMRDFESGRQIFAETASWKSFDKRSSFDSLPTDVRLMLKDLYPNKQKSGIEYSEAEIRAIEVSENYSWPLRDWSEFTKTFQEKKLKASISKSQARYRFRLDQIAMDYHQRKLENEKAKELIETELALFVQRSGLGEAAKTWHERVYTGEKTIQALAR